VSGLSDGAEDIPSYGDHPSQRSAVLADPVSLSRTTLNPAALRLGFAPYFLTLALWVGAMIVFMVLRPLNRRYVMSGAPAYGSRWPGCCPRSRSASSRRSCCSACHAALGLSPVHGAATLAC